jgi:hypothetical protein
MEQHWFSENPADVPWMSIRDLGIAGVFMSHTSEFLTAEAVEKFRVKRIPDNTVVLSFKLTMGRVAITDGEMLSNEAIAHFRLNPDTSFGSAYLYCYLKGFSYTNSAARRPSPPRSTPTWFAACVCSFLQKESPKHSSERSSRCSRK